MENNIFDLLVANAISPNTDASDLTMTISNKRRTAEQIEQILLAVCDVDIFKASTAVHSLMNDSKQHCTDFVYKQLLKHCEQPSLLSKADLLAILVYDDYELFCKVILQISPETIKETFSAISAANACRFMRMCIDFGDENLISLCEEEFYTFLSDFDSRGYDALSKLLPKLIQCNCANIITKLLDIFGPEHISRLYGPSFGDGIKELITSGYESPGIWDAFFYDLFSGEHTPKELLIDGIWFLQLYATDEAAVAACFFLYAIKHLSLRHSVFNYIGGFDYPSAFSRKHTIAYEEEIKKRWNKPDALLKFLEITELCNPFAAENLQNRDELLIKEKGFYSPADYELLCRLFDLGTPCEKIIKIFLNTFLKKRLVMEDLLQISRERGVLNEMIAAFQDVFFVGLVEKYNIGDLVVSPKNFYCKHLHVVVVNPSQFNYLQSKEEADGKISRDAHTNIEYHIAGFFSGQIHIVLALPESTSSEEEEVGDWNAIIAQCEEALSEPVISKKIKNRIKSSFDFSESLFKEEYDLNLLTDLIARNSHKLDEILSFLETAGWNSVFRLSDVRIESHLYTDFVHYRKPAIEMFKKLMADGCDYEKILILYFESIYKLIVPLQLLLIVSDKEQMLKALSNRTIYCNMPRKERRYECRPLTIACAPICIMQDADIYLDQKVAAKCVDYTIVDGYIKKIYFANTDTGVLSRKELGNWFGYVAASTKTSSTKKSLIPRLPDASEYDIREMIFILECMEKAISLRKNSSGEFELLNFLNAMGKKNPFAFQQDIRLDIDYLTKFFSRDKEKISKSTMSLVVLNVNNLKNVEKIYLNTSFKYYLTVNELVSLIKSRKFILFDDIESFFSDTAFECAVDNAGYLWSPFILQNTVKVDAGFCGSNVLCRLTSDKNGIIHAQVLSVQKNISPLKAILPALMTGYSLTDGIIPTIITTLTKNGGLTRDEAEKLTQNKNQLIVKTAKLVDPQPSEYLIRSSTTLSEDRLVGLLKENLTADPFDFSDFKKNLATLIEKNRDLVSVDEMEGIVAELTEVFMRRFSDNLEATLTLLKTIFSSYSYYYRDNGIIHIWINQLNRFFGETAAHDYKEAIINSARYLKNKKVF